MTVPPALLRRVRRVLLSDPPDPLQVDENVDDVILLWRAYERSFGTAQSMRSRMRDVTKETASKIGLKSLPELHRLAGILRKFDGASDETIDAWFVTEVSDRSIAEDRAVWRRRLRVLAEAGAAPLARWNERDTRELAEFLYSVRNGVMHGSLETTADLSQRVLPAVRDALLALCVARIAVLSPCTVDGARQLLAQSTDGNR